MEKGGMAIALLGPTASLWFLAQKFNSSGQLSLFLFPNAFSGPYLAKDSALHPHPPPRAAPKWLQGCLQRALVAVYQGGPTFFLGG